MSRQEATSSSLAPSIATNTGKSSIAPPISDSPPTSSRSPITTPRSALAPFARSRIRATATELAGLPALRRWLHSERDPSRQRPYLLDFLSGGTRRRRALDGGPLCLRRHAPKHPPDVHPAIATPARCAGISDRPSRLRALRPGLGLRERAQTSVCGTRATGVPLAFTLPAGHAAIAVIGKKEKKIVARYGF